MRVFLVFLFLSSFLHAQVNSSIIHNGLTRTFVYYTPNTWNASNEVPLVILMHGLTQTGAGVMDITQFNQIAEQNNFIVVYPDGENFAWNADMNVTVSTADDLGFIESLAAYFQNNFNTDASRQYLVGFSNGGFMSHKIACESSMCFAAIATVSGNMSDITYANCSPQFTPAVMHIHGTADAIVPYNGGPGTGVSVDQTMQKWANALVCNNTPTSSAMPNTNIFDLSSPSLITYQNGVSELKHIKIDGGGHQWPGIQTLVGGAGTINFDFYSPQVIWDFLNGKSCASNSVEELYQSITISPNPANDVLSFSSSDIFKYELISVTGTLIENGTLQKSLCVNSLSSGVYLLNLQNDHFNQTIKFVKE